ncbi:hypothetical protein [uncultured Cellulomonas sp.]|uniref:hypothetical protein n=1 Tax=uncultured Cellulomonas sp. TaxID=189682 RepID=UPI002635DD81|nr:hypothetical protein [uncultured Cellulomonas sp.]
MAMADVIVLRSARTGTGTDAPSDTHRPGRHGDRPGRDREPVHPSAVGASGDPDPAAPAADDVPWPLAFLPGLLTDEEEATAPDGVHRYRGTQALYPDGCRQLEVTGSQTDPTSVRLTLVWHDGVEPQARAAAVEAWTAQAAAGGWRPGGGDDLVGPVVVEQYQPVATAADAAQSQAVVHDWSRLTDDGGGSRTSGRPT